MFERKEVYHKKVIFAALVVLILILVSGGGLVSASECVVVPKPDGAGNIGDVVVNVCTGESTLPTNPGGKTKGGFVDVYLDVDCDGTGDVLLINDTFLLPSSTALDGIPAPHLPEVAMNAAGPGKGIDKV